MTQETFDKMYDEGMESNKISLTDSQTITKDDLLDSAIYKMYFQEEKTLGEIEVILIGKLKQFEKDFKNFL